MLFITQRDVELVEGYGVYLSKQQLDEAVYAVRNKLIWNLIGVFFTRNVLASSSVYGKEKNPCFDKDIVSTCLSNYS